MSCIGGKRTEHNIGEDLVIIHLDMADCNTQTQNLLELELDGGTNFSEFIVEVFGV
jgi:hypothetical protein